MEKQKVRLAANKYTNKYVITIVELIWEKLDYYYSLSNVTLAYQAGVLLHPSRKFWWFETHWALRPKWQEAVKDDFEEFAYASLKSRPPTLKVMATHSSPHKRKPCTKYQPKDSNSNQGKEVRDPITKEINCYLNSPVVKRLVRNNGTKININVINWWFNRRNKYPVLSLIALNLTAAPLESSDLERKFSDALNIFTDKRNSLKPDTIEALMLLKSGLHEGLQLQACSQSNISN